MNALLDAVRRALGNAQQLDPKPEFVGGGQIGEGDRFDAFDRDGARINFGAESQRGEDRELVGRVEPANVKGRV